MVPIGLPVSDRESGFRLFYLSTFASFVFLAWYFLLGILFVADCRAQVSNSFVPWQRKTFTDVFSDERTFPRIDHGFLFSFRRVVRDNRQISIVVQSLRTGQ